MQPTRVDTPQLTAAIDTAIHHLEQVALVLKPFFPVLSEDDRRNTAKPPDAFPEVAHSVVEVLKGFPQIAQLARFDRDAVLEDLANTTQLARLRPHIEHLARITGDARLLWLSEAFIALLQAYAIARGAEAVEPELARLIGPFKGLFSGGRPARTEG